MSAPALRLRELLLPFGRERGLEPLSIEVARGERLVVVGSSGAGKTTLLRAVAGLAPVSAGSIEIGGRDVARVPPERRDAVYLHQTPVLFPHLDVFENVAFPLRVRGVRGAEVGERVRRVLEAVRMEEYARRAPRTLSGGQGHRVALARAIVARPSVLLLDEPLSSLDPALRDEVRGAILTLQEEYRPALVLVTHDLDEAGLLADRIGVLLDRRLAQVAPPAELFTRPASLAVARFLGIENELHGEVDAEGRFHSPLGPLTLAGGEVLPGPARLAFRPDALRVVRSGGVQGEVAALRHRARDTVALVRLEGIALEALVDRRRPPAVGERIRLELDSRRVSVFSDRGDPAAGVDR